MRLLIELIGFLSVMFLVVGLISPNTGLFWLKRGRTRVNVILICIVFFSLVRLLSNYGAPQNNTLPQIKNPKTHHSTYTLIASEANDHSENFFVVINTTDNSKENIEKIINEIRHQICARRCFVSAYDDKFYYELEKKMRAEQKALMRKLGTTINQNQYKEGLTEISKKYYVEIADHFIGFTEYGGNFTYYPYRDWKYKKLGGKILKD